MTGDEAALPASIGGIAMGAEVRSSGALRVHEGTDQLGLAVRVHLVPTSALSPTFGEEDFLAAVRAAAAVRHECLLGYTTGGVEAGWAFAVSKSPDARGLDEVLARGGGLAEERSLEVAAALCGALEALESHGVRHGALTPRRVLFPGRGAVLLRPPRILPVALAPRRKRYQAPEEARGEAGNVQSDLFCVGVILAECLTGDHPLRGARKEVHAALARGRIPPADEIAPKAGPGARAVLARLLAPDPADRYPSAAAARLALEAALRGEVPSAAPAAAPVPVPEAIPVAAPLDEERPETAPIGQIDVAAVAAQAKAEIPTLGAASGDTVVKRQPGRLHLDSRLGQAMLEIDEDVYLGKPSDAIDIHARPSLFDEAVVRVERTRTADLLHALVDGVTVNGAPVTKWELKHGDAIEAGPIVGRYERGTRTALRATGAGAGREPPPGARLSKLVLMTAVLASVAVLGWAVLAGTDAFRPIEDARAAAERAERRLAEERRARATARATQSPDTSNQREQNAQDMLERARDWVRAHPDDPEGGKASLAEVAKRYPETASALLAEREIDAVDRRHRARLSEAVEKLVAEAHAEAAEGRLDAALRLLRQYPDDHDGTLHGERVRRAAVEIENGVKARFRSDMKKVDSAIVRRDWRVALNVLTRVMDYVPLDLRDTALAKRVEVQEAMEGVSSGGGTARRPKRPPRKPDGGGRGPSAGNGGGEKPPVKPDTPTGGPDDAAARDEAAKQAFKAARRLMNSKQETEAIRAFIAFMETYKDTPTGAKRDREVRARLRSLVQGPAGVPALFRGTCEKQKGGRWRITYDFEDEAQLQDFRDVNAFEAPPRAEWSVVSGSVRTKGSGALVLDAAFTSDFVSVKVTLTPDRPHDLGIILLEPGEPRRHYLYTLQNSFFTLGKGRDEKRFSGHAVVLFGPGMWRDTPPDQIGFVKKCGSDEPRVGKGRLIEIKGAKDDAVVWMQFPGGKRIRGSAYGDVKYEFKGFEPGVFVVNSGGFFDDIVVDGTPDPDWVTQRWDAIINGL